MSPSSSSLKTVLGGISGSPRHLLDTENLPFCSPGALTLRLPFVLVVLAPHLRTTPPSTLPPGLKPRL